jgi:hypothetical protein
MSAFIQSKTPPSLQFQANSAFAYQLWREGTDLLNGRIASIASQKIILAEEFCCAKQALSSVKNAVTANPSTMDLFKR